MAGLLMGAYGAVTYLFFFGTFLYAIAFVDDLPFAPKTLDSGAQGPLVPSLLVDALLLGLFAVQHSVMARPAFKRWWTRVVAPPIERSTYVLLASAALVVMFVFWRPFNQPIWEVAPGPLATALLTLSLIGWGIVLISTFLISHFELFGLTQVYQRLRGQTAPGAAVPHPRVLSAGASPDLRGLHHRLLGHAANVARAPLLRGRHAGLHRDRDPARGA